MELQNFTRKDIPYEILAGFGLTKQMIDDLPNSVQQKLLTGRNTPPLPVEDRTQDGEIAHAISKISLFRRDDGEMDVYFTPRKELMNISRFPDIDPEKLKSGKVLRVNNGYIQYNDIIEQVAFVPYGILTHNLQNVQDKVGFSQKDMDALIKGNPVVISEGEYKGCTVGIDLLSDNLVRLSKGNVEDWQKEEGENKMQKYNFGMFGCWVCEENSIMHYIQSQDYDRHPDLMDAYEIMNRQQNKIK